MKADTVIESRDQLVAYLESGCKPKDQWRIGTEHEKFCYHTDDLSPLEYGGGCGIRALLEAFAAQGWEKIHEEGNLIALSRDGASITLEPGGQLELSGKLLTSIHQTCDEVNTHLAQAKEVGEALGTGFLGLGFHPTLTRDAAPHMPKGRYDIMRRYMPKKGSLGLDMMHRTCTVQVNLDFSDEADMRRKFRVGLALQPLATALFANSPFTEGVLNGYRSYRSHIWTDTDPDRTGMLPFVFEEGFGFERWVDYMLDVPMYFVHRGRYLDAAGLSFRDFLAGRLDILPGEKPTLKDWEDHLTTVFPEVRLKTFMEMRGADGGPWSRLCALPALWVGLMYDDTALAAADDLIRGWNIADMADLRRRVPRQALQAPWAGGTLQDLAKEVLEIASAGLRARTKLDSSGNDETGFLASLVESAESGITPADSLIEKFRGEWKGNIRRVFEDLHY